LEILHTFAELNRASHYTAVNSEYFEVSVVPIAMML